MTSVTKNSSSSCHFAYAQKILKTKIGTNLKGLRLPTQNLQWGKNAELVFNNLQESFSPFDFRFNSFPFRTHGHVFSGVVLWIPEMKMIAPMKIQAKVNPPKAVFYFKKILPLRFRSQWKAVKSKNNSSTHHINSFQKKKSCVPPKS